MISGVRSVFDQVAETNAVLESVRSSISFWLRMLVYVIGQAVISSDIQQVLPGNGGSHAKKEEYQQLLHS